MHELFPGLFNAPHIHPAFVHLPLALWMIAPLFLLLGAWRKRDDLYTVGLWLLWLGLAGAAAAIGTGLQAEADLGHDSPHHVLVHVHKNWMLVAGGLGALVATAAFLLRKRAGNLHRWAIAMAMLVTTAVTTLGADRGANLVLGHGIGTRTEAAGAGPPAPPHHEH